MSRRLPCSLSREPQNNLLLRAGSLAILVVIALVLPPSSFAQTAKKPNILVIFGDDIGQANISRYTHGVVGYMTPILTESARKA